MGADRVQREELDELLIALTGGETLTPDQRTRLNRLLRDHADLRAHFLAYMEMHTHLHWQHGSPQFTQAVQAIFPAPLRGPAAGSVPPVQGPRWRHASRWLGFTVAAAALLVFLAAWSFLFPHRPEPRTAPPDSDPGPRAQLIREIDCEWVASGATPIQFAELPLRQPLRLERGIAEMAFRHGARLLLEGPAVVEVVDEQRVRLHEGQLTAFVPSAAQGFAVETAQTTIIDRGTQFGIAVDRQGRTEVHVFQGEVELHAPATPQPRFAVQSLQAGAAVRVNAAEPVAAIDLNPKRFAQILARTDTAPPGAPPAAARLALWLAADSGVKLDAQGRAFAWHGKMPEATLGSLAAWQQNASARPRWIDKAGRVPPTLRFEGQQHLVLPTTGELGLCLADYELFVVAASSHKDIQFLLAAGERSGPENFELHINGAAGARFIPHRGGRQPGGDKFADLQKSGAYADGRLHLFHARVNDGTAHIQVDDVASTDTVAEARSSLDAALVIGVRGNGTYPLHGDIAEVLIYREPLSPEERAQVMHMLNTKYGLPAGPP
ncbi:MAG: FecR domain-containing protein [Planctomycetia bacterium]|nr:FecR domain-containing protein [Planctomycetia bacterium]